MWRGLYDSIRNNRYFIDKQRAVMTNDSCKCGEGYDDKASKQVKCK